MDKTRYILFVILMLPMMILAQDWQVVEIGPCPTQKPFDVNLADGRTDGINRLYVSTFQGGLYEWTHQNSQWVMSSTLANDLIALGSLASGAGRNDGVNRVYLVEFKNANARLREFTWNGQGWDQFTIEDQIQSLGVVLGDGRNDGVNRLYVTSIELGLMEYSYINGSWQKRNVEPGAGEGAPDIGDGHNDGGSAVYAPATNVWESRFQNGQFANDGLDAATTWPDALQIAPGRNDGVNRIYANCTGNGGKGRKEYTWNGADWDIEIVESASQRGDIHVARLHQDGKYRVYINTSEYFRGPTGPLDEYEWDGNQWTKTQTVMATGTHATAMMASGDGRNDKTHRMYVPHWTTGDIYEITHVDPFVNIPVNTLDVAITDFTVSPNPSKDNSIQIEFADNKWELVSRYEVTDVFGKIIESGSITGSKIILKESMLYQSGYYTISFQTYEGKTFSEQIIRL